MICFRRLFTTTALVTLTAMPATANVTANDVWSGVTNYYRALGLTVSATEIRSGNRLALNDLKASAKFPFDLGSVTITTTGLELVENTDGTVNIVVPGNLPLALALSLPDDIYATATFDFRLSGFQGQVTGTAQEFTMKSHTAREDLKVTSLNVMGPNTRKIDFDLNFSGTINDITSQTTIATGDTIVVTQDITYGYADMEIGYSGTKGSLGSFSSDQTMTINRMENHTIWSIPNSGVDLLNLSAGLRDGLSFQATSEMRQQVSTQRETLNGKTIADQQTSVGQSNTTLGFSRNGVSMAMAAKDYDINATLAESPVPIRAAIAGLALKLGGPLLKSDAEQGFDYAIDLEGLTLADELWNLFDANTVLSRGPAKVKVDLSGKVRLLYDLPNFDVLSRAIKDKRDIAELTALTINGLDFSAAGAQLTGTGAFTFDNNDRTTFKGLPAPTGAISLQMSGLNTLMDKLIQMGLLENDEALGMRMGLGLFTVVGDGNDTLLSDIEVKPDGKILANGKRIK